MFLPLKRDCVSVCALSKQTRTQHCLSSAGKFFQQPRFLLVSLFLSPFPSARSFYHSYLHHHPSPPCITPRLATLHYSPTHLYQHVQNPSWGFKVVAGAKISSKVRRRCTPPITVLVSPQSSWVMQTKLDAGNRRC